MSRVERSGKAGDSPEEPAEKVLGKAKYEKVLKQQRKSRKEIERKRRRKKRSVKTGKRKRPSTSSVSTIDSPTDIELEDES